MRFILLSALFSFTFLFCHSQGLAKGIKREYQDPSTRKQNSAPKLNELEKKELSSLQRRAQRMRLDGEGQRASQTKSGKARLIETTCPVDEHKFKAWDIERQPPEKGMDRDFCKHAKNPSAYEFDVWFCSSCGYANFKTNFSLPISEAIRNKVEKEGTPMLTKLFKDIYKINVLKIGYTLDQEDLPAAAKYALMNIYIDDFDYDHKFKAKFYLQYAWIERTRFISSLTDPTLVALSTKLSSNYHQYHLAHYQKSAKRENDEYIGMRELRHYNRIEDYSPWKVLNFFKTLNEDKMSNEEKLLKYTFEAKQWDRLGFRHAAEEHLKKAAKLNLTPKQKQLVQFRSQILSHEHVLLNKALIEIKEAMKANEYSPEKLPHYVYLLAELYRRTGLYDEATLWFGVAKNIPEKGYGLIPKWTEEQLELIPKDHTQKAPELEYIFATKIEKQLKENINSQKPVELPSMKNDLKRVISWLHILGKASKSFFDAYEFDPTGLQELIDEGLLKSHPELEKHATRYFELKVDKRKALDNRYTIISRLPYPYQNSKGFYFPAFNGDAIKQIPMN